MQQEIFRQIVRLDESRILSRLRSSHARSFKRKRGTPRPELMTSLNQAVLDKSIIGRDETAKALINSIRMSSKELSQRFSEFENIRENPDRINFSRDVLMEVLQQIERFDVDGLQTVLSMSRLIDPSLEDHLPRAMSKIGRYFRIACDLVDAARSTGYTLFRRISVRPVNRPRLDMAFLANQTPNFDQVTQRVTGSSYRRLLDAYGLASVSKTQEKFESRMSFCPIPWKVHAEIQLLLFYDQQSQGSRPRLIGSSKSACYLCDLFVKLHGRYCLPRTHGKLYDRWMLPEQSIERHTPNRHLTSVIDRFNAALEAKIIQILRSTSQPLHRPHPIESVLFLRKPWSPASTLLSTHEQGSMQGQADPFSGKISRDQKDSPSVTSYRSLPPPVTFDPSPARRRQTPDHSPEPMDLTQDNQSERQEETQADTPPYSSSQPHSALSNLTNPHPLTHTPQNESQAQPNFKSPELNPCPPNPSPIIQHLSPGDSTIHKFNNPQDTLIIETGPITIHASRPSHPSPLPLGHPSPNPCWIYIQRLTSESLTTHDADNYESIDVSSLTTDHDTIVESGAAMSSKSLALRRGGHVVLLKYILENAETMSAKG